VVGSGSADLAEVARRLDALREVDHPGLCIPEGIGLEADGEVVATMPRIRGETALALSRVRKGLSVGECVAIGIDVAEALAEMHARGLAHGDVSPANIVVSPSRAVLVDTLAGSSRRERGTRGFAAPERAVGATPAGDVYSLGRVLEALVEEAGKGRIEAWSEPLCRPDPSARPTARVAARALLDCSEPVPVTIPETSVAGAIRLRSVGPEEETVRVPDGRLWRIRRAAIVWGRRSGLAIGAALGAFLVARLIGAVIPDGPGYNYLPTIPLPADSIASAPGDAAVSLVEDRITALAEADPGALLEVTTADGAARAADAPLAERLESGELRYVGLSVEVALSEALSEEGNRATVRVSYDVSGHTVRDGGTTVEIPATSTVVDVDLVWGDGRWRVEQTRAVP